MSIDPLKPPALKGFSDGHILTAVQQTGTGNPPGPLSNLRDTHDRIFFPDPDKQPTPQNIKDWAETTQNDYRKAVRDAHDHGWRAGVKKGQENISTEAKWHLVAKGAGLGISLAGPVGYWIAQHKNKKSQSESVTA